MSHEDRPTLLHCTRCGVAILLHLDEEEVRFDRLCPNCTARQQQIADVIFYSCVLIAGLIVVGALLHVLFPPHPRVVPVVPDGTVKELER